MVTTITNPFEIEEINEENNVKPSAHDPRIVISLGPMAEKSVHTFSRESCQLKADAKY